MFPSSKVDYCDFNTDDSKEIWINRLKGVDLVINIVGILQTNKKDSAKKSMSYLQYLFLRLVLCKK